MTNKKDHPLLQQHFSARAPVPSHPHGHKNGAKVSAFVIMPVDIDKPDGTHGLLMVKRQSGNGKIWWEMPGGSMESADSNQPFKTAVRETLEEAGVYVRAVFHLPGEYKTPRGRTSNFYWCQYQDGKPHNAADDQHMEVAVIEPHEFSVADVDGKKQVFVRGDEVQLPINLIVGMCPHLKASLDKAQDMPTPKNP